MAIANITNNILTDSGTLISSLATSATTISTTSPLQGGGDLSANRTLSITQSGTASNGYLSSTDWNTFNGKGSGTVTSVAALTIGTTGTDLSSSVANSTTTPVITLNVPTASATNRGALSSADWTTFNNKQSALTNPVTGTGNNNYLAKFTSTGSTIGNSTVQDDGTNVSITGGFTANSFLRVFKNGSDSLGVGPFTALYNAAGTAAIFQQLNASNGLDWWTTFGKLMTLTASGNLGLGVNPSAWSIGKGFDINGGMALLSVSNASFVLNNAYYNGGWIYKASSFAQNFLLNNDGSFQFNIAPSGTAGNAISFTQAMTLTASGRLLINTPTESTYQLDVNGTGRFSGALTATQFNVSTSGGATQIYNTGGGHTVITNATANKDMNYQVSGTGGHYFSGAATFSSSVTATGLSLITAGSTAALIQGTGTNVYSSLSFQNTTTGYGYDIGFGGSASIAPNSFYIYGGSTATVKFSINSAGAATYTNSVTATSFFESSDSRLKTLIQDNYQTKGIASITPKLYTKNGKVELGYYAQDFVGILDSAVSKGSDDMLSLSYREVLVAKVYALEQRIKELENK